MNLPFLAVYINLLCYLAFFFVRYSAPIHWLIHGHDLLTAKCHKRATLRKAWRQTRNRAILTTVARDQSMQLKVAWCCRWNLSAFFIFVFVLLCYMTNHLMTGSLGNSEFCFPRISRFAFTSFGETLRFLGNKIHCSPQNQSLSVK